LTSIALRQLVRFVLIGVLNTAFGFAIYAIATFGGLSPALALACSLVCGVVFNFFTTGRLVFGRRAASTFPKFVAAYIAVYVVNLVLLSWIISLGFDQLVAQAIALPPTVAFTFVLMKFAVFRA
jgi:putative flippase GtrA